MGLQRVMSAMVVLGIMWILAGCSDSSTSSSSSAGTVQGVAVPSQVNVVTAN